MAGNDELIVDLTGYKDRVGTRVQPGRYRVVVEDVEPDTSKNGNPMVNVWFLIQGGEFDGATITDRLVLTEKSLFRVVGFMQAIGLPTPKKRLKLNIRQFVGKSLDVDVDDGEPYNGRVKSEVRGYMRVQKGSKGGEKEQADLDDLPGEGDSDGMSAFRGAAQAEAEQKPAAAAQETHADEPSSPSAKARQSDSEEKVDPWTGKPDNSGSTADEADELDLDELDV